MQQTPTAAAGQPAQDPGATAPTPIQQAITDATRAVLRGEAHLLDLMVQAAHGALFPQPVPAPVAAADTDIGARFEAWQNVHFASGDAQPVKLGAADRRFVVQHPSRSVPTCVDCKHHIYRGNIKPTCNHPAQPVNVDDGQPWVWPMRARTEQQVCSDRGLFFCGPSGLGFAPIEAQTAPPEADQFIAEWLAGRLALPLACCSVRQLHKAYGHWCTQAGNQWPIGLNRFQAKVSAAHGCRLLLSRTTDSAGDRTAFRMVAPDQVEQPTNAVSVAAALAMFSEELAKFLGSATPTSNSTAS